MKTRRCTLVIVLALFPLCLGAFPCEGTPIRTGFPRLSAGVGYARQSRLLIADLGLTAGHKSIVFGTSGPLPSPSDPGGVPTGAGSLFVVNWDGTLATGFPVAFNASSASCGNPVNAEVNTPAIGDLQAGGHVIVVGYGSTFNGVTIPGGIRAFNTDGTCRWDKPGKDWNSDGHPRPVYATPAIADVDGDGKQEAAYGGYDGWVYLKDLDTGSDKPGWPVFMKDSVWSSPALFDLNGDGKKEIIIGVDAHPDTVLGHATPFGGCLWVFQSNGGVEPGFPHCIGEVIWSSPAVGDINGDGIPEIVFGTGEYLSDPGNPDNFPNYTLQHKLFAITRAGQAAPGWPFNLANNEEVGTSPALADLSGNGTLKVIFTTFRTTYQSGGNTDMRSRLYVVNGDGSLFGSVIPRTGDLVPVDAYKGLDPAVADITGDGKPEILVPYNWEVAVFDGTSLAQLTAPGLIQFNTYGPVGAVSVGALDTGGKATVAVATSGDSVGGSNVNKTSVIAWDMKTGPATPVWGNFHEGTARLGVVPGTLVPPPFVSPTVTSVSPLTGPTTGGTSLTVSGTGFQSGATFAVGGSSATGVTFVNATTLTGSTPSGVVGAVSVTVTNPDLRFGTGGSFTYYLQPAIISLSLTSGPVAGGSLVDILGSGFVSGATVTYGGVSPASTTFLGSGQLRTITPPYPAGSVDVVVRNPDGRTATRTGGFTFVPSVSSFYTISPPCRIVDTRNATGTFGGPALTAQQSRAFPLIGQCGIPAGATAVSLNLTIADATAIGNLRLFPGAGPAPLSNAISFRPGRNRANNSLIGLTNGNVTVFDEQATGTVHVIVDVNGYFR